MLLISAVQFLLTWGCYHVFALGQGLERLLLINVLLQLFFSLLFYVAAQRVFRIQYNRFWLLAAYGYVLILVGLGYWG